ncbi:F-box protein CPR30-like isoform X2 [Chenopodium quinoa]|uniref:F-box domain-containing protein n=1 Tax=Chenopodium quinoa TaxID=63459 RepID=A0A803LUE1_CHEQI|nr:F-box protein CPR30-like isoform X2 [Chenopodium quinoa]
MASTPVDIIDNGILPRLPAKSLVRFKCVSKKWLALISSDEFILRHLDYVLYSNSNQLLILTGNDGFLYSFNLDLPKSPAVKLPSFGEQPFVVGSCNGLLCIQSIRPYCLFLLNPTTGSYRQIPTYYPPRRYTALNFGFGYDSNNDDYKVVRIVDQHPRVMGFFFPETERIVRVYSSRANSWEEMKLTPPQDSMGDRKNGVLVNNNLLHWKFWSLEEGKYRICCFNLCENKWTHDVPLPDYMGNDIRDGLLDFGVFDGCLYLSTKNLQQSVVDIWVMNDYGVKESWVKLVQISDSHVFGSLRVSPIAYDRLNHQILLRTANKTEHKILWYDIKGETTKSAEFNGVSYCLGIDVCKSSLVNVPGAQIGTSEQKDENEGMQI